MQFTERNNNMIDPTTKKAIKETAKGIGKVCKYVTGTVLWPYIVPRITRGYSDDWKDGTGALFPSLMIGSFIYIIEGAVASHLGMLKEHHLLYAIPIGTNIASGIYEYYRYNKNKYLAKKTPPSPIASVPVTSPLETKVETIIQEAKIPEQKPIQITNPWEVDIPEIKNLVYEGKK